MKKTKIFLMAVFCLMISAIAKADDTPIAPETLPQDAKTFVQTNFSGKKIIYAEKDWNSYECRLDDGTKIEFNKKGVWQKIDCKGMTAVPAAIVPKAIQKYVDSNFQNCVVTKIDKERYGYEVELSNDIDLRFNYKGQFIGMDD